MFGILKGRFRALRLPIQWHDRDVINDMFLTACTLHNMLLKHDDGDTAWERTPLDKAAAGIVQRERDTEFDELETDSEDDEEWNGDIKYSFQGKRLTVKRNTDYSHMAHGVGTMMSDAEAEAGFFTFRQQLKTHFAIEYRARRVEWLGKKGGGGGPADPRRRNAS